MYLHINPSLKHNYLHFTVKIFCKHIILTTILLYLHYLLYLILYSYLMITILLMIVFKLFYNIVDIIIIIHYPVILSKI